MKNLFLFLLLLSFLAYDSVANDTLEIQFIHKHGNEIFEFNKEYTNNLGKKYLVNRLEYYISRFGFRINANTIVFNDIYLLVNPKFNEKYIFNVINVDSVDEISFYIGVDSAKNHSDPTQYPFFHPLAPKDPSMHWGWEAGYNFIATEGLVGKNMNTIMAAHSLGNRNYKRVTLPVKIRKIEDKYVLNIIADYSKMYDNIDLDQGLFTHGDDPISDKFIDDFSKNTFSISIESNIKEINSELTIDKFNDYIIIQNDKLEKYDLKIYDLLGNLVDEMEINEKFNQVSLNNSGIYFLIFSNSTNKFYYKLNNY